MAGIFVPLNLELPDGILVPGPQGPQGPAGPVGATGPQGPVANLWRYVPLSGNNTQAFNEFLSSAVAAGVRSVTVSGCVEFHSQPTIPAGIHITGESSSTTQLQRCYSGDFIEFSSGFNGGLHRLCLYAMSGTSGGNALSLKSSASLSPDYSSFSDLVVTGAGTYAWPLHIDGSARTTPQGLRDVEFRNVNLFCGTSGAANIINGVGLNFIGFSAYPAGGSSGSVYVGGGSDTINFYGANVMGEFNLTNLSRLTFFGHMNSMNSAGSASKCYIVGTAGPGPFINNLTSSAVGLV